MGNADSQPVVDNTASSSMANTNKNKSKENPAHQIDADELRESSHHNKRVNRSTSRENDDQVNVNMAMADLMAYLQVVANNSNHLPLTIRDDPELDRTVSTLSSEDYARKSAAFVPADVRVIGGTFTRYGRVWDLPTSQEYNACDGAHEPGRSYGGACANTMLKVVYDAANELEGAAQTEAAAQALFEDDDDSEDDEPSVTGKSFKSGYSLDFHHAANQMTWAALLRQMKSEFKEVGYAQSPKITTTRKIDLNQPFTLSSDNFDPKRNKKRSLLIGCNYNSVPGAELKASHDDIRSVKDFIVNVHGFSEHPDYMTVLLDEDNHTPPTYTNIIESFKTLSEQAMPGDAVFVQFSGHGGRVLDAAVDAEAESYDEVIVPNDYEDVGLIRDTLIFKTLLAPMRYGVTLTVLIDCCDTGMVLELPYSWTTKSDKRDSVAKLTMNEDFSFVRFLKVVKTLYESSTFTQLGKTVGSALNPLSAPSYNSKLDEESRKSGRSTKKGDSKKTSSPGSDSIFDALADACSATHKDTNNENMSSRKGHEKQLHSFDDQSSTIARRDTLFEQVIKGCSLLSSPVAEEFSDEDTFKTRTEEEDLSYFSEGESFETMEDDYSSPRHKSSSNHRRSSKRRH